MSKSEPLYQERDTDDLGESFKNHLAALQTENLTDAGIAAELAYRDNQLEYVQQHNQQLIDQMASGGIHAPDICPFTGRKFFMLISHPDHGLMATYGGPFDSYTIPERDKDGEYFHYRYDHDEGGWVDPESIGMTVVDDQKYVFDEDYKTERDHLLTQLLKLARSATALLKDDNTAERDKVTHEVTAALNLAQKLLVPSERVALDVDSDPEKTE